ncbi:IS66 family transposase [Leptospira inadai]|uniref:IS66 family transposase n=1 Tax=Leptospira inadai TaxID=29506 RepID=UPI001EE2AE65|nr:transposase [Leptospira inadai]
MCLFSKIQKIREEKSKPILDDLKTFLDSAYSQVLPKSPIGEAIRYTLNEWERLTIYLYHGEFYIDNNLVENGIRPFVIGRKNWLFLGSPDGTEASTFFFSIVQTAIANKKDPYVVLLTLFEGMPASHSTQDFESLFSKSMGWVYLSAYDSSPTSVTFPTSSSYCLLSSESERVRLLSSVLCKHGNIPLEFDCGKEAES